MAKSPQLTSKTLRELGLFSAYDVSKWASERGISPIYLERRERKIMKVKWTWFEEPHWAVLDSTQPGAVIKKFYLTGDASMKELKTRAADWVEANYGVPMKYVFSMRAMFSAPAVDILAHNLQVMRNLQSMDPELVSKVSFEEKARFILEHPRVPVATSTKLLGV